MNEKGFVFPIALIIATSIMFLIGFMVEQFILEKRFYKEVEESLISNHLLLLAVTDLEQDWRGSEKITIHNGILFYPKGDVYYEVISQNDEQASVRCYGSTLNERKSIAIIYYDKSLQKVVEWMEN